MKLEPKVEDSTWVHPQPEVILPSLIPLVFERFFAYFNFVVVPKPSSRAFFCPFELCGCPQPVVLPKQSSPNSLGTLRMVVGMLGQRRLCIAHLGPFSGAEETQIPKTNVRVEDKKVL